jgi:hypothetical protein
MMSFPMSFLPIFMINTITTSPIGGHLNRKVKITPLTLRNFPNPSTPPFFTPQFLHKAKVL